MKKTQADRILELLQSQPEVSARDLSQVSLQYSARVKELRAAGHKITNRVETVKGGKRGFFRLVREVSAYLPNPAAAQVGGSSVRRTRKVTPSQASFGPNGRNELFSTAQLSGCVREWRLPD